MRKRKWFQMLKPPYVAGRVCDECGAILTVPWWWTPKRSPRKCICDSCYQKRVLVGKLADSMFGPDPPDPRYE